ncbi:MAG: S24/S26 family peptidase [bacterium]
MLIKLENGDFRDTELKQGDILVVNEQEGTLQIKRLISKKYENLYFMQMWTDGLGNNKKIKTYEKPSYPHKNKIYHNEFRLQDNFAIKNLFFLILNSTNLTANLCIGSQNENEHWWQLSEKK